MLTIQELLDRYLLGSIEPLLFGYAMFFMALGALCGRFFTTGTDTLKKLLEFVNLKSHAPLSHPTPPHFPNSKVPKSERHLSTTSLPSVEGSTMGKITAEVAHEIRSPLTVLLAKCVHIQEYSVTWHLDGKNPQEIPGAGNLKQDLETIVRMAKRIEALTRTLGGLVRGAKAETQMRWSTSKVIEESQALWKDRLRIQGVRLEVELKDDPILPGELIHLSQVLINLVNNSLDAVHGCLDPWIKIEAFEREDIIHIRVIDNGTSPDLRLLNDTKMPFFSTKKEGYGLGLAIVREILEKYKGHLSLDLEAGCTCFTVSLPLVSRSSLAP